MSKVPNCVKTKIQNETNPGPASYNVNLPLSPTDPNKEEPGKRSLFTTTKREVPHYNKFNF